MSSKVVLVGYSGHGLVVADAAVEQGLNLVYYTEKRPVEQNPFNLEYLGFEGHPEFDQWEKRLSFALGIGNNVIRKKTAEIILERGKELVNIFHPKASLSKSFKFGIGNFINNCAVVNSQTIIGDFCILNTGSILEHECQLGDAVHVAPGAVIAGGVNVGDNTFIGANSVIREGLKIGKNVIIGAGSVILNDVADNIKIVGNPGRRI